MILKAGLKSKKSRVITKKKPGFSDTAIGYDNNSNRVFTWL